MPSWLFPKADVLRMRAFSESVLLPSWLPVLFPVATYRTNVRVVSMQVVSDRTCFVVRQALPFPEIESAQDPNAHCLVGLVFALSAKIVMTLIVMPS